MEFFVRTRSKQTKFFIERIVPSMIKQLGLGRSKKLLFIKIARAGLDDNDGLTSHIKHLGAIVVLLKPQSLDRLGVTLAHEMVHVKQIANGKLKTVNGVNYWNGKRYSSRTKYLNQPWEVEAFSKQELIFRRAID
jgi:hypothetical protein